MFAHAVPSSRIAVPHLENLVCLYTSRLNSDFLFYLLTLTNHFFISWFVCLSSVTLRDPTKAPCILFLHLPILLAAYWPVRTSWKNAKGFVEYDIEKVTKGNLLRIPKPQKNKGELSSHTIITSSWYCLCWTQHQGPSTSPWEVWWMHWLLFVMCEQTCMSAEFWKDLKSYPLIQFGTCSKYKWSLPQDLGLSCFLKTSGNSEDEREH